MKSFQCGDKQIKCLIPEPDLCMIIPVHQKEQKAAGPYIKQKRKNKAEQQPMTELFGKMIG